MGWRSSARLLGGERSRRWRTASAASPPPPRLRLLGASVVRGGTHVGAAPRRRKASDRAYALRREERRAQDYEAAARRPLILGARGAMCAPDSRIRSAVRPLRAPAPRFAATAPGSVVGVLGGGADVLVQGWPRQLLGAPSDGGLRGTHLTDPCGGGSRRARLARWGPPSEPHARRVRLGALRGAEHTPPSAAGRRARELLATVSRWRRCGRPRE